MRCRCPLLEHFWESSQRRAIACEHMGHQLYSFDPGLGYSFGLFCHVGMPVLVKAVRGYASTVTEALAARTAPLPRPRTPTTAPTTPWWAPSWARTWHLPGDVAQAIWLHHDFACLGDARFSTVVRQLVALGLLAEYLVNQHDGLEPSREWLQHGRACLQHLQVSDEELNHWIDELHPAFEAVGS